MLLRDDVRRDLSAWQSRPRQGQPLPFTLFPTLSLASDVARMQRLRQRDSTRGSGRRAIASSGFINDCIGCTGWGEENSFRQTSDARSAAPSSPREPTKALPAPLACCACRRLAPITPSYSLASLPHTTHRMSTHASQTPHFRHCPPEAAAGSAGAGVDVDATNATRPLAGKCGSEAAGPAVQWLGLGHGSSLGSCSAVCTAVPRGYSVHPTHAALTSPSPHATRAINYQTGPCD